MANPIDEMNGPVAKEGHDVNVIAKQIPVKVGFGSYAFEVALWVLGIIPGVIFLTKKIEAGNYFRALEQKIQHDASQIDNYLEQRVVILTNLSKLLEKSIDLDKDVLTKVAAYRGGVNPEADASRNETANAIEGISKKINIAVENYPDIKSHTEIMEAIEQNSYLQKEITAARELYNDDIGVWNRDIFVWPVKMMVAAKAGYTSRIHFSTSEDIKTKAREVLF